jgi:hypothetical protein
MEQTMSSTAAPVTESRVWGRIIAPDSPGFSKEAAGSILQLKFSEADQARMNELVRRNREESLSEVVRKELETFVKVGDVLCLMHLKAMRVLSDRPNPRS